MLTVSIFAEKSSIVQWTDLNLLLSLRLTSWHWAVQKSESLVEMPCMLISYALHEASVIFTCRVQVGASHMWDFRANHESVVIEIVSLA